MLRNALLPFLVLVTLGGCATTASSYATQVGPAQLEPDASNCSLDATVPILLLAADSGNDVVVSGVYVGNGYVVTSSQAPFGDAENVYVTFLLAGSDSIARAQAEVVATDADRGFALLRIPVGPPACSVVLADMRMVRSGDEVRNSVLDGVNRGSVVHPYYPFREPGHDNDVLLLSSHFNVALEGSGVFAENGTLVGLRAFGRHADTGDAIALPADRIARFLQAHGVDYKQYDHTMGHGHVTTSNK